MKNAYIIDAIRTPFGRYAGGLAPVRADDLGALPIKALMERNPSVNREQVDDVIYGCANQAGEDNRNVGRMFTTCRSALSGAGNDREPSVWFIDGCSRDGSTCN